MGFKAPENSLPKNVAVGDTVSFEIRQTKNGMFEITSIAPTAAPAQKPVEGAMKDGTKGMKK